MVGNSKTGYKRYQKDICRKNKKNSKANKKLKLKLLFTSLFTLVITVFGYFAHQLKNIKDGYRKVDYNKFIIEKEVSDENHEYVTVTENIEEVKETFKEPFIPVDIGESNSFIEMDPPIEKLSTDLLDMGYDFKSIDFEALKEINEDVVGWITVDGTNNEIDYPILQGIDNEYYLEKDIYQKYSFYGSIFLDARNNTLENKYYDLSDVSIIYGHNNKNTTTFGKICYYKKQSFLDEHPFFVIYTTDGYAYMASVFAGVLYDGTTDANLYTYDFYNKDNFMDYINYLKINSMIESDVELEYGDKIIALVTCSYENGINGNLRFVVFAKLSKQYTNVNQLDNRNTAKLVLR